ncbi:hypothetical protein [Vibrio marinisediminis]|uniref:hypothetical protein n=1 Tax=Vibrio marinisediminis TaxID=2758441 RepID=UPI003F672E32
MNSDVLSDLEVALIKGIYEPPIEFKRNTLAYVVSVSTVLSRRDLKRFIQDFFTFGNAYCQAVHSAAGYGPVVRIKHIPALFIRRREDLGYTYKPRMYDDDGRFDYFDDQIYDIAQ